MQRFPNLNVNTLQMEDSRTNWLFKIERRNMICEHKLKLFSPAFHTRLNSWFYYTDDWNVLIRIEKYGTRKAGSVGKGTWPQAWRPESVLMDPCSRRELYPASGPLTSAHVPWYIHMHAGKHACMHAHTRNKYFKDTELNFFC